MTDLAVRVRHYYTAFLLSYCRGLLLVTTETYLPSPSLVLYMPTDVGTKSYEIQNAALYSLFALL